MKSIKVNIQLWNKKCNLKLPLTHVGMAPVAMPSSGLRTSISQVRNQIFKSQLGYAREVGGLVFKLIGDPLPMSVESGISSSSLESLMRVVDPVMEFFLCSAIDQK